MPSLWLRNVFLVLAGLNVALTMLGVSKVVNLKKKRHEPEYTYIGDDFPFLNPALKDLPLASMTLQETSHYSFNASDPLSFREWETLTGYPGGFGRYHLGADRRSFLATFYHQIHCIRQLNMALLDKNDKTATPHHVNHCLQYLRQTVLCTAAGTLEKGDFMERNFETDRVGPEVMCVDWEAAYSRHDDAWGRFTEWRKHWN